MGKLKSIAINSEIKKLYDLEIADNHNFVVNDGLVIHNSEQYLDDQGNCCLASIFFGKFFDGASKYNKDELNKISISINRFLDNIIEMELISGRYATYEQKHSLESLRRSGAGFTDIVSLLFQNNMEYGSKEGNELIEQVVDDYNYFLYSASIALGKEKGSFKAFDRDKYIASAYIKSIMKRHPDLQFETMRNVCVSSVAPTGTLSLMSRDSVLSYGIEPSFGLYYWKRTRISGKYEYYFVLPKVVKDVLRKNGIEINMPSDSIKDTWDGRHGKEFAKIVDENIGKCNIKFKSAADIKVNDKLDLMARVQKLIDSSISVTYLLPENSTWKEVYDFILLAYEKELKSIAAFPDRKMYGIVSFIPFKELAFKLKSENVDIHAQNFSKEEQDEIGIFDANITNTQQAPKRPKILDADIYVVNIKNEKFLMCIGLLNGKPYEVFGGHMNGFAFKFQHKKGKIEKIKRGHYKLEIGDEVEVDNFGEKFTPTEQSTFRLVSTSLRHGVPLQYIVEQLQKSEDDMFSLSAAAARVLKKYIKDGVAATGMSCPMCGSQELIYSEGCVSCKCGYSKCQ